MALSNYYGLLPEERPGLLSGSAAFYNRMMAEPPIDEQAAMEDLPAWIRVGSSWPLLIPAVRGASRLGQVGVGAAKEASKELARFDPSRRQALKTIGSTVGKSLLDYAPVLSEAIRLLPDPKEDLVDLEIPVNDIGVTLLEWINAKYYDQGEGSDNVWPADHVSRKQALRREDREPLTEDELAYTNNETEWWDKHLEDVREDMPEMFNNPDAKRFVYAKSLRKAIKDYSDNPDKALKDFADRPEKYVRFYETVTPFIDRQASASSKDGWRIDGGESLAERRYGDYWTDDFDLKIYDTLEDAKKDASRMLLDYTTEIRRAWLDEDGALTEPVGKYGWGGSMLDPLSSN